MKQRAQNTISERQLTIALGATGRTVALEKLADWRKDGLLPPLANTGTGKGRSYYWREDNILARAQLVCDAMCSHGRKDQALVTLFLSGFSVPLAPLRRAWLHQARLREPRAVQMAQERLDAFALLDTSADALLLQAALCASMALQTNDMTDLKMESVLARAMCKLGLARDGTKEACLTSQLSRLVLIIGAVLGQSNLIREAADQELLEAQQFFTPAAAFLSDCDVAGFISSSAGPLLFIFLLALLHSGQTRLLNRALAFVGDKDGQVRAKSAISPCQLGNHRFTLIDQGPIGRPVI